MKTHTPLAHMKKKTTHSFTAIAFTYYFVNQTFIFFSFLRPTVDNTYNPIDRCNDSQIPI